MKLSRILGLSALAFVAFALIFVPYFLNPNQYKPLIEEQLTKALGRKVTVGGNIEARLLPTPKLKIRDVTIGNPEGMKSPYFAQMKSFKIYPKILPLLSKSVVIEEVAFDHPTLYLEKNSAGQNNWSLAKKSSDDSKSPVSVNLETVSVEEGIVTYQTGTSKTKVSDLNIEVDLESLNGPYEVEMDGKLDGKEFEIEGDVGVLASNIPLTLKGNILSQDIEIEGQFDQTQLSLDGILKIKGDLKDITPNLPTGLLQKYKVKSAIRANTQSVNLTKLEGTLGSLMALGSVTYDLNTSQVSLNTSINPGKAKLSLMTHLNQGTTSGDIKISAQNLDVILGALKIPTDSLPQNLTHNLNVKAHIEKSTSGFAITGLDFAQGSAKLQGSLSLQNWPKNPQMTYDLSTPDLTSVILIADPTFKQALGKTLIRGSTSGTFDKMTTRNQILIAESQMTLDGSIILKETSGTKSVSFKDLSLALQGASLQRTLNGLGIGSTSPLGAYTVSVTINREGNYWTLSTINSNINLSGTPVSLKGSSNLTLGTHKPKLSANLAFGAITLPKSAPSQPSQTASSVSKSGTAKYSDRWSHKPIDLSSLKSVDAEIQFTCPMLRTETLEYKNAHGSLRIANGVLEVPGIQAEVFGGSASLKARVSTQQGQPIDIKAAIKNANLQDIAPKEGRIRLTRGILNMNLDLSTHGNSEFNYVKNLGGAVNIQATNGKIQGFDLQKLIAKLKNVNTARGFADLIGRTFEGGTTDFTNLKIDWDVKEGIARIVHFDAGIPGLDSKVDGKISLPAYSANINSKFSFTELKNFPPIGVHFYGSLDNIQKEIDSKALQNYMIQNVFSSVLKDIKKNGAKPEKILKGLLGLGGHSQEPASTSAAENQKQQAEQAPPVRPDKVLKSIFKGLR